MVAVERRATMAEKLERQRTYDRKQVKPRPVQPSRFRLPDTRPTGREWGEIPSMEELVRRQAQERRQAKLASAVRVGDLSTVAEGDKPPKEAVGGSGGR
jgi:hypothetical protein